MSIYRNKKTGRYEFEFDRIIQDQRVRVRKQLPKSWDKNQADAFDIKESSRLYAIATGVTKPTWLVEDAVNLYVTHRIKELKHGIDYAQALAIMMPYYKAKTLDSLTDVCQQYQREAVKEDGKPLAPATIKNRIRYLTSAVRYAWKHHGVGDQDPAARVTVPVVRNERKVYIDRADMLKLCLNCANRQTRQLIRIGFYSGMRFSEIMKARIEGGNFVLDDTKNGDSRIIPIHPRIRSAMPKQWQTKFKLMYWFRDAREKAGMPWLHFHDCRHSSASAMIQDGVALHTVGAVLGHRSAASTRRYAHLATDNLKAAIGRIGRKSV